MISLELLHVLPRQNGPDARRRRISIRVVDLRDGTGEPIGYGRALGRGSCRSSPRVVLLARLPLDALGRREADLARQGRRLGAVVPAEAPRRRRRPSRRRATCRGRARASSSSCVPCSTITPCSSTTIRSASRIVERRCAMMNAVRPCEQAAERALDLPLGADVDGARRLVEDQDARVGEQRARERDELALAEREPRAALAELRLVAVLEPGDELVGADGARRRGDLLARRVRAARTRCSRRPCRRTGSPPAGRSRAAGGASCCVTVAQVGAVDRDRALGRVVEAREQLRDRRLAGAGVPDERDGRAGRRRRGRSRAAPPARGRTRSGRPRSATCPAIWPSSRAPGASSTSGASSSTSVILSSAATAERNVL